MFVDTIVGHSKIFLLDSLCFYKGIKVSFVRASRKSNFVIAPKGDSGTHKIITNWKHGKIHWELSSKNGHRETCNQHSFLVYILDSNALLYEYEHSLIMQIDNLLV